LNARVGSLTANKERFFFWRTVSTEDDKPHFEYCFDKEMALQRFGEGIDWRLIRNGILILFAVWILAGMALACSTRLEMISTLMICSGLFLLGLFSDYLFGVAAAEGVWWAKVMYAVLPNWQLFWMADALEKDKMVPVQYLVSAFGYMAAYVGAVLAAALWLFEDRELN